MWPTAPSSGTVVLQPDDLPDDGWFVGPTIGAGVSPDGRLARQEIFGPVLSVFPAAGLDEALALANDTQYALTAGILSRSPVTIRRASSELRAGNIYVNRGITGAVVGRQPLRRPRPLGCGFEGRRPRPPVAVPRAAGGDREHAAPGFRGHDRIGGPSYLSGSVGKPAYTSEPACLSLGATGLPRRSTPATSCARPCKAAAGPPSDPDKAWPAGGGRLAAGAGTHSLDRVLFYTPEAIRSRKSAIAGSFSGMRCRERIRSNRVTKYVSSRRKSS